MGLLFGRSLGYDFAPETNRCLYRELLNTC
jgi:hypothetical protein